jgi:heme/copper-type cytochrome/quinol oxidase subunit 2
MPRDTSKKGNARLYITAVVIIVIIIIVGVLAYELSSSMTNPSPTPTPSTTPTASPTPTPSATPTPSPTPSGTPLTLYADSYGFGDSAGNIISPGPTLHLNVGQTYTMTVHNVASIPHSWEIVATKAVGTPIFGAGINVNTYIQPGQSGSVTFTPDQTGNFYYVCTVPGHIALGMWGNVEIT